MRSRAVLGVLSSLLAALGASAAAVAQPVTGPTPSLAGRAPAALDQSAAQARAALARVEQLFAVGAGGTGTSRAAAVHGREVTLALRDLLVLRGSLTGADRARADSFLARPTEHTSNTSDIEYTVAEAPPVCGPHVCIHYVAPGTNKDAVPAGDTSPANGIPDYVDLVAATVESVHTTYTTAGYRPPKSDQLSPHNGGNGLTDVYLAEIGVYGYYGYCTSDDPSLVEREVSAYCVLDDDYAEFPGQTRVANLRVTAAHEYFHAVQFAYDVLEDPWFMEATAMWAEDELYDTINDNVSYLDDGQIHYPGTPLDKFSGRFHYGNWIFVRYLTERWSTESGGLPVLVRQLWEQASAAEPGDSDLYGIAAIRSSLVARGTTFAATYGRFAEAVRRRSSFDEGVANEYPVKPLAGSATLTPGTRSTGRVVRTMDHLTNGTWQVTPGSTMTAADWRLRVNVDLPWYPTTRGMAALVTVRSRSGTTSIRPVSLSSTGDASLSVRFDRGSVAFVEVTLVNGSTRFNCWINPDKRFSCEGLPKDDDLALAFTATAYRS